jgi:hypothetical protein
MELIEVYLTSCISLCFKREIFKESLVQMHGEIMKSSFITKIVVFKIPRSG